VRRTRAGAGRKDARGPFTVRADLRLALLTLLPVANLGCSLAFTQAPELDIHPPPPCNTYVASPVADTILATASVGFMVFGVVVAATPCGGGACYAPLVGWSAVIAGGLAAAVFTTSAVVGYQRTSGCRALEESKGTPPSAPGMPSALLLYESPLEACVPKGDTPRQCPSAAVRQ
jgi:hypothetical protein